MQAQQGQQQLAPLAGTGDAASLCRCAVSQVAILSAAYAALVVPAVTCRGPADKSRAWLQMLVLAPASKTWRTKCSGATRLQQAGTCEGGKPSWSTLGAPLLPPKHTLRNNQWYLFMW